MPPRLPQTPPALFFKRTARAVLRLVPAMAAVSIALWPKHAPTLVLGLLGICVAMFAACRLARRGGRRTPA